MYIITPMLFVSLFITVILVLLMLLISDKSNKDREKLSPFECGFDPFKKSRVPFSLRFFLVTVIFLVFDVEIALLLPLGLIPLFSDFFYMMISVSIIILVLIAGLMHEWNQGALKWLS